MRPRRWLHGLLCLAACTGKPGSDEQAPVDVLPARTLEGDGLAEQPKPPVELTASDGTGLRLLALDARAVVEGPIAFTELRLTFENPHDRRIEGRFAIELPGRAALSRLAMKIGGSWQEGEVVERQAARVAYEDALHRKQDPALLEHDAGNRFTARVFPIEPRERKEIIVSYSQELASAHDSYRLPLRGLSQLDQLDAEVRIVHADAAPSVTALHQRDVMPSEDFAVPIVDAAESLRHDNLAVARITVGGDAAEVAIDELVVLFDTSASGAPGFDARIVRLRALLDALAAELGAKARLRVLAFDQQVVEIHRGTFAELGDDAMAKLATRRALGASDLTRALQAAAEHTSAGARVLLVSDGMATAGATDLASLERAASASAEAGVVRIDALAEGRSRADGTLVSITTAPGLDAGMVIDADAPLESIVHRLRTRAHEQLPVVVPGANWVWPEQLSGVQPGDEVLVYADVAKDVALRIQLGDATDAIEPRSEDAPGPLLERAWTRAYLERMQDKRSRLLPTDQQGRDALQRIIVDVSTSKRVLSEFTALLVLESEGDYRRFGIDRNALADILVVGDDGVQTTRHRDPQTWLGLTRFPSESESESEVGRWNGLDGGQPMGRDELIHLAATSGVLGLPAAALAGAEGLDDYGVGGLGLVGTGRGGGGIGEGVGFGGLGYIGHGSGYGAGKGSSAFAPASIRLPRPFVEGGHDPDIAARIVRAHVNELRFCFRPVVARDPNAHGQLELALVTSPGGRVSHASILGESFDEQIGACVLRYAQGWQFPALDNRAPGLVITSPFFGEGKPKSPKPSPAELARLRELAAASPAHDMAIEAVALRESLEQATAEMRAMAELAIVTAEAARTEGSPYDGKFYDVMLALDEGHTQAALELALAWHDADPGDVLALLALGEVAEAAHDVGTAARAYGSIIDLFPARADLRRYAGARLERLGGDALQLAVDDYRAALASRPDHPSSHRALAMALARTGALREAAGVLQSALHEGRIIWDRFAQADRILREDLTIVAAAWLAAEPATAGEVRALLAMEQLTVAGGSSLRFVLSWETDANDVDFHIHDGGEGHAFYGERKLPSGGELYADITTGYGPECFAIPGKPAAFPYRLGAHYYARGPMGYGMGRVQVVQHDGNGKLSFEEHPFIAMKDKAWVELGTITGPLE